MPLRKGIKKRTKKIVKKKTVKAYVIKPIVSKRQQKKEEMRRAAQRFSKKNFPEPTRKAKQALDKLRVTKRRLGRFIFFDAQGREIERSRRRNFLRVKGYMAFVSKNGTKRLIKQHRNIAGQPIVGVISDHNIFSSKVRVAKAAKERARNYFLSRYLFEIESSTTEMKTQYHTYTDVEVQGGRGAQINFYEFAEELSAKIAKVANRIRRSEHIRTVVLTVELHVKFFNKQNQLEKIVPVNMPVIWWRGKGLMRKDFAFPIITSAGYSNIVEILNRMGIVLASSGKYVNRLLQQGRATKNSRGVVTYYRRFKRHGKMVRKEKKRKKQNYKPVELYSLGAIIKVFRNQ